MKRIDLVFPYVDCRKPQWQADFENVAGVPFSREKERYYADGELLRYKLRATELYMPWIRKVFVIVHDKSQVPDWIDTDMVKVVEHKDFIPKEFLPVFNSCAIEMFVHLIEDLSEYYIYSNDDFLPNGKLTPDDFFYQDFDGSIKTNNQLSIINIGSQKKRKEHYFQIARNSYEFSRKHFYSAYLRNLDETEYPQTPHVSAPMIKGFCNSVYQRYKYEITSSVSPFRQYNNLNQYLWSFCAMGAGVCSTTIKYRHRYCATEKSDLGMILKVLQNEKYREIVLNDTKKTDYSIYPRIYQALGEKYPFACKYERQN